MEQKLESFRNKKQLLLNFNSAAKIMSVIKYLIKISHQ